MDDRLKESISALIDNEANELELQRVLSQVDSEELAEKWQAYHFVRSVMHGEQEQVLNIDVTRAVSAAIADEHDEGYSDNHTLLEANNDMSFERDDTDSDALVSGSADHDSASRYFTRNSGLWAVAASIVFAVVFVIGGGSSSLKGQPDVPLLVDRQTDFQSTPESGLDREPKIISEFSQAQERRLNEYLLRHAEHSVVSARPGTMPFVRVASVNSVGI